MSYTFNQCSQGVLHHHMLKEAWVGTRPLSNRCFFQPIFWFGHINKWALQAIKSEKTTWSISHIILIEVKKIVLHLDYLFTFTYLSAKFRPSSLRLKSSSFGRFGSAAKTMTRGKPWNGSLSSCSRLDSSVFSNESRMYSSDDGLEYVQKQPKI